MELTMSPKNTKVSMSAKATSVEPNILSDSSGLRAEANKNIPKRIPQPVVEKAIGNIAVPNTRILLHFIKIKLLLFFFTLNSCKRYIFV